MNFYSAKKGQKKVKEKTKNRRKVQTHMQRGIWQDMQTNERVAREILSEAGEVEEFVDEDAEEV